MYKRGVPASQLPVRHYYLKNTPKEELFAEINKSNVKPKQRQKCLNELVRRGIKIQWVSQGECVMAKAWGSNHVSHRKKTSQGNGRGTFSINMNKHKKRSTKNTGAR